MATQSKSVYYSQCFDTFDLNSLLKIYERLKAQPSAYKSHFLEGCFENIYLDASTFSALQIILDETKTFVDE